MKEYLKEKAIRPIAPAPPSPYLPIPALPPCPFPDLGRAPEKADVTEADVEILKIAGTNLYRQWADGMLTPKEVTGLIQATAKLVEMRRKIYGLRYGPKDEGKHGQPYVRTYD